MIRIILFILLPWTVLANPPAPNPIKVGVPTILTGDLSVLGTNATETIETYQKYYLRHNLEFYFEDSRLGSQDGLKAYQALINLKNVDLILAVCTSNGTMPAKKLIDTSKTPTITIATGGEGIDRAGPWVFRISNSDIINGSQQAEVILKQKSKRIALFSEETEYTLDISNAFQKTIKDSGEELVFNESFIPGDFNYRAVVTRMKSKKPDAIFMPTQTGTAFGVFLKQWHQQKGGNVPIYTTFVAAPNPDARAAAGDLLKGTRYLAPAYAHESKAYQEFHKKYFADHGHAPPIEFHAAGIVDSLNLLQNFLDTHKSYNKNKFQKYLLDLEEYCGLLGCYQFDEQGNTKLGFIEEEVK